MCKTSRQTIELLHKRASRLVKWMECQLEGTEAPRMLIDDELRMVEESIRQYRSERDAESN